MLDLSKVSSSQTFEKSTPKLGDLVPLPPDLPRANIRTISLARLQDGDKTEAENLLQACKSEGFFYLNLQNVDPALRDAIQDIYRLEEQLYSLPLEEKLLYDVDKISNMKLNGYKPLGRNFGGTAGQKDAFETWAFQAIQFLDRSGKWASLYPHVISKHMASLRSLASGMNQAGQTIFESLSNSLKIPGNKSFETYHRPAFASSDIIRLLKYQPQPICERGTPLTAHTDLGSLSFVFARSPGLQILEPSTNNWRWVEPLEDHIVVNIGDSMAMLSNKLFKSCLHRVGPLPGVAMDLRYSFGYFVRAENEALLVGPECANIPATDPNEPTFTGAEWLQKKFGTLRFDSHEKKERWILLGEKERMWIA